MAKNIAETVSDRVSFAFFVEGLCNNMCGFCQVSAQYIRISFEVMAEVLSVFGLEK